MIQSSLVNSSRNVSSMPAFYLEKLFWPENPIYGFWSKKFFFRNSLNSLIMNPHRSLGVKLMSVTRFSNVKGGWQGQLVCDITYNVITSKTTNHKSSFIRGCNRVTMNFPQINSLSDYILCLNHKINRLTSEMDNSEHHSIDQIQNCKFRSWHNSQNYHGIRLLMVNHGNWPNPSSSHGHNLINEQFQNFLHQI